ncbi:RES family NAD+ phosphorylase, partial [Rugamonas sp. CCM 8940]|uniref:RES family NAD+ phosphorylase n=1 Tax=Rugamonas sp. CCM 8940 TaxID=2765359 RepID=UPI0018F56E7C
RRPCLLPFKLKGQAWRNQGQATRLWFMDRLRSSGYDGILAPSARNLAGSNLIIFPKENK